MILDDSLDAGGREQTVVIQEGQRLTIHGTVDDAAASDARMSELTQNERDELQQAGGYIRAMEITSR